MFTDETSQEELQEDELKKTRLQLAQKYQQHTNDLQEEKQDPVAIDRTTFMAQWVASGIEIDIKRINRNLNHFIATKQFLKELKSLSIKLEDLIEFTNDKKTLAHLRLVLVLASGDLKALINEVEKNTTPHLKFINDFLAIQNDLFENVHVNTKEYDYITIWKSHGIESLLRKMKNNFYDFYTTDKLLTHLQLLLSKITEFMPAAQDLPNAKKTPELINRQKSLISIQNKILEIIEDLSIYEFGNLKNEFAKLEADIISISPVRLYADDLFRNKDLFTYFLRYLTNDNDLFNLYSCSKYMMKILYAIFSNPNKLQEELTAIIRKNADKKMEVLVNRLNYVMPGSIKDQARLTMPSLKWAIAADIVKLNNYNTTLDEAMKKVFQQLSTENIDNIPYFTMKKLVEAINSQAQGDYYPKVWYKGIIRNPIAFSFSLLLFIGLTIGGSFLMKYAVNLSNNKSILDQIGGTVVGVIAFAILVVALINAIGILLASCDCIGNATQTYGKHSIRYLLSEHKDLLNRLLNDQTIQSKLDISQLSTIEDLSKYLEKMMLQLKVESMYDEIKSLHEEIETFIKSTDQDAIPELAQWKKHKETSDELEKNYHVTFTRYGTWKPPKPTIKPGQNIALTQDEADALFEIMVSNPDERQPLLKNNA